MSSVLKQIAYAFSPFTKAAGSTVSSVNGVVGKAIEKNGQYVVASDKEYMELPLKFLYSTLARYAPTLCLSNDISFPSPLLKTSPD